MKRFAVAFAVVFTTTCATPTPSPPAAATTTTAAKTLQWQWWSSAVFEQAKKEHKLVFVDAGIEGCTACRWMHESTLADARVIDRLATEFVIVAVDADQQPDVGARFSDWAWPALVFYDADGH